MLFARDGGPDIMLVAVVSHVSATRAFSTRNAMGSAVSSAQPTALDGTGLHERFEDHCLESWSIH
jgi:hypothetical protein